MGVGPVTSFDQTTMWLIIIAVSVVTYALRVSFLFGIEYLGEFPQPLERLLVFFPIGVLSALIAPDLLLVDGTVAIGLGNLRLIAGTIALVVAWYSESILITVGVGMAMLYLLTAL